MNAPLDDPAGEQREADAYRAAGGDLMRSGARMLALWRGAAMVPADPTTVAGEVARDLRRVLALAEQLASAPPPAPGAAVEIWKLAATCTELTTLLYTAAAELWPDVVAELLADDDPTEP